jgi:hypothetical protein
MTKLDKRRNGLKGQPSLRHDPPASLRPGCRTWRGRPGVVAAQAPQGPPLRAQPRRDGRHRLPSQPSGCLCHQLAASVSATECHLSVQSDAESGTAWQRPAQGRAARAGRRQAPPMSDHCDLARRPGPRRAGPGRPAGAPGPRGPGLLTGRLPKVLGSPGGHDAEPASGPGPRTRTLHRATRATGLHQSWEVPQLAETPCTKGLGTPP